MALSLIQKQWLTEANLYQNLMNIASSLDNQMITLTSKLEWLNLITAGDMTDLSIPAGTQTLLGNYRTALNTLIEEYNTSVAALSDAIRTL